MKFFVALFLVVALADLFHCTPTHGKVGHVTLKPNDTPKHPVAMKTEEEAKSPVATKEPSTNGLPSVYIVPYSFVRPYPVLYIGQQSQQDLSQQSQQDLSQQPQQDLSHKPQQDLSQQPQQDPQPQTLLYAPPFILPDGYFVFPLASPIPATYDQQNSSVVENSQVLTQNNTVLAAKEQ
uniref:SFRICE_005725 n=1 Tax=Spodoptera frugiperda TaxID=7108 RepID=A0A2H1WLV3_SPOFR